MQIAIGKIIPNPDNPRKDFDPATLEELSSSIRQHGLLNPIAVEENNGVYILIDGERRWRAAKLAGWAEIPAEVRERTNNIQRLMLALVANLQREDMNPIDEARAFEQLKKAGDEQYQNRAPVGGEHPESGQSPQTFGD
jgi:ParB family chromosome partitioning protein